MLPNSSASAANTTPATVGARRSVNAVASAKAGPIRAR